MATSFQVTFDTADPDGIATFWAAALGYKKQDPPPGFATWEAFLEARGVPRELWNSRAAIVDPDGKRPRIFFQQVPESKTVKNRVHLDLNISGGPGAPLEDRRQRVDAEVRRLLALGATTVRPYEESGDYWVVMQDPEGNELCVH